MTNSNKGFFIPVYIDLFGHPKFKKLCRLLNEEKPHVAGCLIALWSWIMRYHSNGEISDSTAADIAEESYWNGDPETFLNGLIEAGFLEQDDEVLRAHAWAEYGGKLIKKRVDNAARKQKERTSRGRHADVTPMSRARGEERREEENIYNTPFNSPTGDDVTVEKHARGEKKIHSSKAEEVYSIYPRKAGRGAALKSIEKALKTVEFETLMEAVREYAGSEYVRTAPPAMIPHPSTWFNQSRWEDDRSEWNRPYDVSRRNGGETDFDSFLPPPRNPTQEDLRIAYGEEV